MSLSTSNSKKTFIKLLLVILGPIFIYLLASEWLIRTQVLPNDNLIKHHKLLFDSKPSVAAFGDSHVARSIHKEGIYNLAYPGDNLPATQAKVRKALKKNSLKRIILQADPHLFSKYRIEKHRPHKADFLKQEKPEYGPFYVLNPFYQSKVKGYWKAYLKTEEGLTNQAPIEKWGAQPFDHVFLENKKNLKGVSDRALKHLPVSTQEQANYRQIYLDLLAQLKQKEVEVCLVRFPAHPVYLETLGSKADSVIDFFRQISLKYEYKFVDLSDFYKNETHRFKDGDHINKAAAPHFTDKVLSSCFN